METIIIKEVYEQRKTTNIRSSMKQETINKFRTWLIDEGMNQKTWAAKNGFEPASVSRILNGRNPGNLEGSENWRIRKAIENEVT
jgi:gp16 family phage-associated protein